MFWWVLAISSVFVDELRSMPTVTTAESPAAKARAITSFRSPLKRSRWAWESISISREPAAGRGLFVDGDQAEPLLLVDDRQQHPARLNAHQLCGLEVCHHHDAPSHHLLGLILLADTGNARAPL